MLSGGINEKLKISSEGIPIGEIRYREIGYKEKLPGFSVRSSS
jgi:hypothetical protein